MQLQVFLPQEILIDLPVHKVTAESEHGSFSLLPQHIDCLAILVPGILTYTSLDNEEIFVAVDEGILVKCGSEIRVSTRHAVQGRELGQLRQKIDQHFRILDDQERRMRSALAQLESGLARYFTASEWGR